MSENMIIKILESLMAESVRRFSETEKSMKVQTWKLALHDLTNDQLKNGFEKAIKSPNEFMISSGQFRELCLSDNGSESLESDAWIAWALVSKNTNAYSNPVFKDSCISEAIRQLGGWYYICSGDVKDETFKRKDFIRTYQILRRRNEKYSSRLAGHHGSRDKFIGYDSKEEIDQAILMIEDKKNSDSKMLKMIREK